MATARDVAKRAGVSTSTVSHVVNGTRVVSDELRARVLQAMHDLGYEANAVARSLKTRRSHLVALVASDIGNPFFTAVVRGVEDVVTQRGYTLVLGSTGEDPHREEAYLRLLGAQRVDGLILAPAGDRYPYLDRIMHTRGAFVLLDRTLPGPNVPAVLLDNVDAARVATRHLLSLGHRRIGMVTGRAGISSTAERTDGYRIELAAAGLPFDPALVADGRSRLDDGRRATAQLLDLAERPTALVVANNLMTIGAVAAIEERGLCVPRDVAVVGFDDALWADVLHPRLTTIAQPTYELGRAAADLLLRRIETPDVHVPLRTAMSGRLIVRESCGAALSL
ncbi:MAG: LacI family DNA-binding transcriptional regulator [Chloroflexota bacterium]